MIGVPAPSARGCGMERSLGQFGDHRLEKGGDASRPYGAFGDQLRAPSGARPGRGRDPLWGLRRNPPGAAQIIAGSSEETAPAAAGRHGLAIQDTSELDFRMRHSHRRGLGLIGKGVGRGILLHLMIAVDAAR